MLLRVITELLKIGFRKIKKILRMLLGNLCSGLLNNMLGCCKGIKKNRKKINVASSFDKFWIKIIFKMRYVSGALSKNSLHEKVKDQLPVVNFRESGIIRLYNGINF